MIYALVYIKIDNPDSLAAYRDKAGDALTKHGGKLEAASKTPTSFEGSLGLPDLAGVLSFPDKDAALAWINDPELAPVHALRRGAGDSSIILVG
ncbi:DUF1330 domain-containing protein [Actibacterium lipolyticum]|uniref:DUF1330 domain-containing protein n=1 Tax=Actibacterium lipolyticum TaxID=1524263 RepID=A0A238KVM0_9RHOB|nr:DUF1330 domain-containing protein [Actibacterium lipolyticum]SMX46222.1 hypothetical protein COL8621_03012 [Actibacterium lipolyticum]